MNLQNSKTLSAILIDDEPLAIENLSALIKNYCPSIEIIDIANNVEVAIKKIEELKPEVIFLDVHLNDKIGFSVLEALTHIPFVVVVTAFEQYSLRALKMSAVDYLLKPIDIKELELTEKKLLALSAIKDQIGDNYKASIKGLPAWMVQKEKLNKITLPGAHGYEILPLNEVTHLQGSDNYSTFYMRCQKKYLVAKTLKEYDELLSQSGFMRVHKSYLVNIAYVDSLQKGEGAELYLKDGLSIPVSRRRINEVHHWIKQHAI
jgi:two-component system LytT family response regulator